MRLGHSLVNEYCKNPSRRGGLNDGAGSWETDLLRNVRGVGHLKFFKIGCNRMLFAMVVESFDGGFKKLNATNTLGDVCDCKARGRIQLWTLD